MSDAHAEFIAKPRARTLKRSGGRIYYVWDGRSRGLGEVVLGRDPIQALKLWSQYESGEIRQPTSTPARTAAQKYRLRADDDPFNALPRWAQVLYSGAETRSRAVGRVMELTPADLAAIIARSEGCCEVSGMPFDLGEGRGRPQPFGPSLDRRDSKMGYSLENCRLVCTIVNYAMNTWGEAPLLQLAEAIAAKKRNA